MYGKILLFACISIEIIKIVTKDSLQGTQNRRNLQCSNGFVYLPTGCFSCRTISSKCLACNTRRQCTECDDDYEGNYCEDAPSSAISIIMGIIWPLGVVGIIIFCCVRSCMIARHARAKNPRVAVTQVRIEEQYPIRNNNNAYNQQNQNPQNPYQENFGVNNIQSNQVHRNIINNENINASERGGIVVNNDQQNRNQNTENQVIFAPDDRAVKGPDAYNSRFQIADEKQVKVVPSDTIHQDKDFNKNFNSNFDDNFKGGQSDKAKPSNSNESNKYSGLYTNANQLDNKPKNSDSESNRDDPSKPANVDDKGASTLVNNYNQASAQPYIEEDAMPDKDSARGYD